MERILTTEERIKRAEEIYERRKNKQIKMSTATVNINNKKNFKLFRKVILQITVCSMIYYMFFCAQSTSYFASKENVENIKKIFTQDSDFKKIYQDIQSKITNIHHEGQNNKEEQVMLEEINQTLEEATLSATEIVYSEAELVEEEELTQMEQDAKDIKEKYHLAKPLEGQITSGFGQRESDNSVVSTNHLGIDIAAEEGTKINAAMEGIVTIAKYSDSYRKLY